MRWLGVRASTFVVCLATSAGAVGPAPEAVEEAEAPVVSREEPAWLIATRARPADSQTLHRRAGWRSMGALLLILGGLYVVHRALQRRSAGSAPRNESRFAVRARFRLGVRQQLVVVEWEGDQLLLGVGPSDICLLRSRPVHGDVGSTEDTIPEALP